MYTPWKSSFQRERKINQLLGMEDFGVRFGDLHPQKGSQDAINRQMAEAAVDTGRMPGMPSIRGMDRLGEFGQSPYDAIAGQLRGVNAAQVARMSNDPRNAIMILQRLLGG